MYELRNKRQNEEKWRTHARTHNDEKMNKTIRYFGFCGASKRDSINGMVNAERKKTGESGGD